MTDQEFKALWGQTQRYCTFSTGPAWLFFGKLVEQSVLSALTKTESEPTDPRMQSPKYVTQAEWDAMVKIPEGRYVIVPNNPFPENEGT